MNKELIRNVILYIEKKFSEENDSEALQILKILKNKIAKKNFFLETSNLSSQNKSNEAARFPLPPEINGELSFALFADGGCRGNPGPGAYGVLIQKSNGEVLFEYRSDVDSLTTNNKMELSAAISALSFLKAYCKNNNLDLSEVKPYLYSDSRYVIDGISKWIDGWKKKGWKKTDGKVPENCELWQELDLLKNAFFQAKFIWVKGHAGHPQNEYCDQLANISLDTLLA